MRTAGLTGLEGKAGKNAATQMPHRVATPLHPHFGKATMDGCTSRAAGFVIRLPRRERFKFRPGLGVWATRLSKSEAFQACADWP